MTGAPERGRPTRRGFGAANLAGANSVLARTMKGAFLDWIMIVDHSLFVDYAPFMSTRSQESIAISEFKAKCLAVLERVRRTGTPVLVTRRGTPVAEIVPPSPASLGARWLGAMRGTATITGDLIAPAGDAGEWEALGR